MSTRASSIPMASVVGSDDEFRDIKKSLNRLNSMMDSIKSGLDGLNVLKIVAFQNSVDGLGSQLSKMERFNQQTDKLGSTIQTLQSRIENMNALLNPISILAYEKNSANKLEAETRQKEFNFKLAQKMAVHKGISEWAAYEQITNTENSANYYMFIGGMIIGTTLFLGGYNASKL